MYSTWHTRRTRCDRLRLPRCCPYWIAAGLRMRRNCHSGCKCCNADEPDHLHGLLRWDSRPTRTRCWGSHSHCPRRSEGTEIAQTHCGSGRKAVAARGRLSCGACSLFTVPIALAWPRRAISQLAMFSDALLRANDAHRPGRRRRRNSGRAVR